MRNFLWLSILLLFMAMVITTALPAHNEPSSAENSKSKEQSLEEYMGNSYERDDFKKEPSPEYNSQETYEYGKRSKRYIERNPIEKSQAKDADYRAKDTKRGHPNHFSEEQRKPQREEWLRSKLNEDKDKDRQYKSKDEYYAHKRNRRQQNGNNNSEETGVPDDIIRRKRQTRDQDESKFYHKREREHWNDRHDNENSSEEQDASDEVLSNEKQVKPGSGKFKKVASAERHNKYNKKYSTEQERKNLGKQDYSRHDYASSKHGHAKPEFVKDISDEDSEEEHDRQAQAEKQKNRTFKRQQGYKYTSNTAGKRAEEQLDSSFEDFSAEKLMKRAEKRQRHNQNFDEDYAQGCEVLGSNSVDANEVTY